MSYERYLDAEYKINEGLIRLGLSLERMEAKPKDPTARMAEMRSFLADCGEPQRGIPAIHVGGTSGKGSVASAIAGVLTEAGLKVGLHVSPYLQSATEKIWVGDRFVSSDGFADLVDWIMPVAAPRVHPDTQASIHGMASVAIALEGFRREHVDVMVFEVGCGGRFDLTSFVETQVAVVTNVGLDHVVSLGPTIEDIAWHKAGIARPGIPLVTGATGNALEVIRREAQAVDAVFVEVPPTGDPVEHNQALAVKAASLMANKMGIRLDRKTVTRGLSRVKLAGRFERMPEANGQVFIDGAHNAEKLKVSLAQTFKDGGKGPKIGVLGFIGSKAKPELVQPLAGQFDHVFATEPRVYAKTACPSEQTARLLEQVGLETTVQPDMFAALDSALEMAGDTGTVLVTGSFYLIGDIRERWFPKEKVVMGGTSWPS